MDFDRKPVRLLNLAGAAAHAAHHALRADGRNPGCRCGADAARLLDVGHARAATRHRRIELSSEGMGMGAGWAWAG